MKVTIPYYTFPKNTAKNLGAFFLYHGSPYLTNKKHLPGTENIGSLEPLYSFEFNSFNITVAYPFFIIYGSTSFV